MKATIEFTEFTLDDDPQVYRLVLRGDFNAICDAEAETKENLLQYVFVIGKPSAIFITSRGSNVDSNALCAPEAGSSAGAAEGGGRTALPGYA